LKLGFSKFAKHLPLLDGTIVSAIKSHVSKARTNGNCTVPVEGVIKKGRKRERGKEGKRKKKGEKVKREENDRSRRFHSSSTRNSIAGCLSGC
jgi:hypothetical protein